MVALAVLQIWLACTPTLADPDAPPRVVVDPPEVGNPVKAFKSLMDRVVHNHRDEVDSCRKAYPGRAGTAMLAFTVEPDGRLAAVRAVDNGDLPGELVGCLMARVENWRVPAPRAGIRMHIRYPLVLRPPGPLHSKVRALATRPSIEGALSPEQIRNVIRAHLKKIQTCYQAELRPCPALHSKIVVRFEIAAKGHVARAAITENTSASRKLEACILHVVRRWRFPEPRDGAPVKVTYPFVFTAP